MRCSVALALAGIASVMASGCQESQTAIIVDFQLVGEGAGEAESLEVLIRCDPDDGEVERLQFDLLLLGEGVEPSLAIETAQDSPCDLSLAAQVYGESNLPIAVADQHLSFQLGSIKRVTMVLDTAACEDLDDDGGVAGLGCPFGGPSLLRDCDEFDDQVNEGVAEVCNSRDDDCNGEVDDLDVVVLEEACVEPVAWKHDVGLCIFWEPQCIDGTIICPELPREDDCELPMDTNCDNRLTCGGCTADLIASAPCNACEEAICDRDEVVCVERHDLDPRPGAPCDELPCGTWVCDPGLGEMVCVAETYTEEICDDPEGLDEDCDGAANGDDDDCVVVVPSEVECAPVILPGVGPGNLTVSLPSCEVVRVFDLGTCEFLGTSGERRNDTKLFIFITVPENVSVGMPEVEGCCACEAHFNSNVTGYDLPAIVVEESVLSVLVMSDETLSIHVPVHIQNEGGSSSYSMTLTVPIIDAPTDAACESFCEIPLL